MLKTRSSLILLLVAALVLAWTLPPDHTLAARQTDTLDVSLEAATAASGTVRLTVNNKTGAVLATLTLTGPKTYVFYNVPTGRSIYEVIKGKYRLTYKACGANRSKILNIQSNLKFNTVSCPVARIRVVNETGGTLILVLNGPASYRFALPPGNTVIVVLKGTYQFTGSGRCGTDRGSLRAQGRMFWTWWCR
jgi:hypothetical protein